MPQGESPPPAAAAPPSAGEQGPRRRDGWALRFVAALVLVSLGTAGFAVLFRGLLGLAMEHGFGASDVVSAFQGLPWWARLGLPAAGALLAGLLARVTARARHGHGVGDVMEAVVIGRVQLSMRTTLLKSLGSWFASAGGGSIGREGPLILFGGSLGDRAADFFRLDDDRARVLTAAGTAAGFAAAYNTPLAAVLFVLEVVAGVVALDAILAAIVGAAVATTVTRAVLGAGPIYGQRDFTPASSHELIAYVVLGLVAALGARLFMGLLSTTEELFSRSRIAQPWRAALGGLLVGGLAVWLPEVTGNGYEPLNALLDGGVALSFVVMLMLAKGLATASSVGSGSPGGVFTPTLFLGAALGLCVHHGLAAAGVTSLGGPGAYALVGMAATTAATTHAPMMAAVLVFELSGDYAIVVPLLVATAVATLISRALRVESIYGAELRRRGFAWEITLDGRRVLQAGRGKAAAAGEEAVAVAVAAAPARREPQTRPEGIDGGGDSG